MKVNANKVIDALELLNGIIMAETRYCPALFRLRHLLIESLKPAPKADADNIDDTRMKV